MKTSYLPGVVKAKYNSGYLLDIYFDDGTHKLIDISKWFKGPVFEPLKKVSYFKKFFVEASTVAWPNGVDISPEALYAAKDAQPVVTARMGTIPAGGKHSRAVPSLSSSE